MQWKARNNSEKRMTEMIEEEALERRRKKKDKEKYILQRDNGNAREGS